MPGGDFIVTVTDSLGCTEIDTFTVVDPFVGLDENGIEDFVVYPNPTNGLLNIQLFKTHSEMILELFDLKGVLIQRQEQNGLSLLQIDLSDLNSGTYIIRLSNNELDEVFKVEKH